MRARFVRPVPNFMCFGSVTCDLNRTLDMLAMLDVTACSQRILTQFREYTIVIIIAFINIGVCVCC